MYDRGLLVKLTITYFTVTVIAIRLVSQQIR